MHFDFIFCNFDELTNSNSFLVWFLEFSTYKIIISGNRDNFPSSFLISVLFISYSCVIVLAKTSSNMLMRNGKNGHSYLVPALGGKAFSFYHWVWCYLLAFDMWPLLLCWGTCLLFKFVEYFYYKRVLKFVKGLFSIYRYYHVILSFVLLL